MRTPVAQYSRSLVQKFFDFLRRYLSIELAVSAGMGTYFKWADFSGWAYSSLPPEGWHWFANNLAVLPTWSAASLVALFVFSIVLTIQHLSALRALKPKLKFSSATTKEQSSLHGTLEQAYYIRMQNLGNERLTNIVLYVYKFEPHQDIYASKTKYLIACPSALNGGDTEDICLVQSQRSDTFYTLSSGEGPLIGKDTPMTIYIRATYAQGAPAQCMVTIMSQESGLLEINMK